MHFTIWTEVEYLFHADEGMPPTSTFNISGVMKALHQAANGHFSLDDLIPVINSFTSIAVESQFSFRIEGEAGTTLFLVWKADPDALARISISRL